MMNNAEGRVKKVMAAVFDLSPDEIGPGLAMGQSSPWDSLHHINLIVALEQEFGTRFSDGEVVTMVDYPAVLQALSSRG